MVDESLVERDSLSDTEVLIEPVVEATVLVESVSEVCTDVELLIDPASETTVLVESVNDV